MSKILISYRREDSPDATGRIYDRLVQQFGRPAVFKDVDSIPLGINFRKHLDEQVAKCDVFLVVIGPDWMGIRAGQGVSRLDDPRDFVRIEIESALKRQVPVIPVLVRGGTIPSPERLPPSLQELVDRNGIVVRHDPDFHHDMDRLIEYLQEQAPFLDEHHKMGDVSARTKETRSEASPSKADSPPRLVKLIEEEPPISTSPSLTTRDQSQLYTFVLIGLIVLIGGVAGFLILQPILPPIESVKNGPPPVVEKKVVLSVEVPSPPSSSQSVEPSVVPGKQEKSVERRVAKNTPPVPTPAMIRISPGSFTMGGRENEETPIHNVEFTKPFAIARYETTFIEYDHFAQATSRDLPADSGGGRGSRPVVNVSWHDAKAYAQWLSQQTGKRYRLPTEAEWEYTAQLWEKTKEAQLKNHDVKSRDTVGTKQPDQLNLHDMSGIVSEWLEDCWHGNYTDAPQDGTAWLETNSGDCSWHVIRSGSWYSAAPNFGRASYRGRRNAVERTKGIGFRLVQEL